MEQPNKRQRLTEYQSIIDTIVNNEITNKDVVNSYNYFTNLKSKDPITQIITDYRNEHEESENYNEDDSMESYPKINYSVVNWLFSTMSNTKNVLSNNLYIPHILQFKFIKNKDILNTFLKQQIENAYKMNNLLNSFPPIKMGTIIVYRGIKDGFLSIIKKNISRGQITFSCFLSTSLFIETAKRFTSDSKHIMSIEIPKENNLAYVSDKLEYINEHSGVTGEAEVLIPMNATLLQISEPKIDGEYTIHQFRLISYLKETRNSQRLANAFVDKFSQDIFDKIDKKEENNDSEEENNDSEESLVDSENSFGGNKLFKINHNKSNKKRPKNKTNKKNTKYNKKNTKSNKKRPKNKTNKKKSNKKIC
jgi:hypothetical protein